MFVGGKEFTSTQPGDSAEFMRKVQATVVGVARDYEPARLYGIRIDNWFGPKWVRFAGKVSVGKHFYAGIHKVALHVPSGMNCLSLNFRFLSQEFPWWVGSFDDSFVAELDHSGWS